MLLHFDFVDNIILYEETDDDKQAELDVIINIIKPYFCFKGPDYNVAEIKKLHPILDNIMIINSPHIPTKSLKLSSKLSLDSYSD